MAIPIQQGSQISTMKAPDVAQGKAVDFSGQISQLAKASAANVDSAFKSLESGVNVASFFKQQNDAKTANDAYIDYTEQLEQLNTKRRQMQLQDALDFQPEYEKKANELHQQFVNRIKGTGAAGEKVRGAVNNHNIQNQTESAMFFWKQSEDVKDISTNGAVAAKTSEVVNGLNTLNAREAINANNTIISDGMNFILSTVKNRLIGKGYREGTPEMEVALQQAIDDYATNIIDELSKRPDNGISTAYNIGNSFKGIMSTDQWKKVMHQASKNNLIDQYAKDFNKFLTNGKIDLKKAAKYSNELNDNERRQVLEQLEHARGNGASAAGAANNVGFQNRWNNKQDAIASDIFGRTFDFSGKDLNLTDEDKKDILTWVREHPSMHAQMYQVLNTWQQWGGGNGKVTDTVPDDNGNLVQGTFSLTESQMRNYSNVANQIRLALYKNPEVVKAGLQSTMFGASDPDEEVAMQVSASAMLDSLSRSPNWIQRNLNPFGIFGKGKVEKVMKPTAVEMQKTITNFFNEHSKYKKKQSEFTDAERIEEMDLLSRYISREFSRKQGLLSFTSEEARNALNANRKSGLQLAAEDMFGKEEDLAGNIQRIISPHNWIKLGIMSAFYGKDWMDRQGLYSFDEMEKRYNIDTIDKRYNIDIINKTSKI